MDLRVSLMLGVSILTITIVNYNQSNRIEALEEKINVIKEETRNVIISEIKANDKDIVSSYVNGDTTVVIKITEEGVQVIKSYIQSN